MTNKDESPGDSRLEVLLAVHLVRQVMDEAYVIANAAKESGEPWNYLLKNLRNMSQTKRDRTVIDDVTFTSKENSAYYHGKNESGNIVVTSTPQKNINSAAEKSKVETSCNIGQGDECYESQQEDLNKSTSVFINHLFDISDVERIIICDEAECIQKGQENAEALQESTHRISNSYVNLAHHILSSQGSPAKIVELNDNNSSYSILEDACASCNKNKMEVETFYTHDDTSENIKGFTSTHILTEVNQESVEQPASLDHTTLKIIENNDIYEYAYLTLNRDYEQSVEAYQDLQDTKGLQEIDLGNSHSSEGDLIAKLKTEEDKTLKATSLISTGTSRRSTLARRCRHQGARFFSCLRGWWQRKSPGKRKELRGPGAARGLYLMSPGLKRKSTSMINQRILDSPRCSGPEAWKFNTVDESTVKSCKWKEYSFDAKESDPQ